jgi:hypothetical protein
MKRTVKKLAKALIAGLDAKYDLVYVEQGDQLTDTQVAAVVKGDWESVWEEASEWADDNRSRGIDAIIGESVADIIRAWEAEDERDYTSISDDFSYSKHEDAVREAISERDSGEWARDLVRATPPVLLRVLVIDEDDAYVNEDVEPEAALRKVGLPLTKHNLAAMAETLANASPEFSSLMGFWIVGADVGQLYDLAYDVKHVTITNPHLYLGNPLMGDGYISDAAFEGTVTVERDALRTDADAFGYGVNDLYGGLNASEYAADILPVITTRLTISGNGQSPTIVATMAGDSDIEVQVNYSALTGRQVVQIDTEQHAQFEVLVNDGRIATVSQGGDIINRLDPGMNLTELLAIRNQVDAAIAALPTTE